jgi:hypothetical protein
MFEWSRLRSCIESRIVHIDCVMGKTHEDYRVGVFIFPIGESVCLEKNDGRNSLAEPATQIMLSSAFEDNRAAQLAQQTDVVGRRSKRARFQKPRQFGLVHLAPQMRQDHPHTCGQASTILALLKCGTCNQSFGMVAYRLEHRVIGQNSTGLCIDIYLADLSQPPP